MKRYSSKAGLALAVLAVLSLAGPVAAGEQVPFKGSLVGDVTITPLDPPFLSVDIDAAGAATQLGRFTLDIPHVVNLATRVAIGTYEFTAANGEATPIGGGVLYIVEVATITGGTGRFAGASGSFTVERWYDTVSGTTTGYFEGTISAPRP